MTNLSSNLHQPTARGRARTLAVATAVALAIGAGFAATSQADAGGVYFDVDDNAAAGDPNFLFNATFTGTDNVGLGRSVMPSLTDGDFNVAAGSFALGDNTSGGSNVAIGVQALQANTSGNNNVATGPDALLFNTEGDNNVAIGRGALSITTGSRNVAPGAAAGQNLTTGSDNVAIANPGKSGESGTIRIGNPNRHTATFIVGIRGTNVGGTAQPVVINSNGKLGTAPAPAPGGLSAAQGEWLLATVKRQQRQIERLRERVRGG
jgi:hypothetical protein